MSGDVRTALNEVISGLGSRGGGLQEKDRKALDRLVAAERTAHKGVKRKRAGPSVAGSGVAFRCDMLVTKDEGKVGGREGGSTVWRSMSCDDEDDFEALKAQRWRAGVDFGTGDPVEIWSVDADGPPSVAGHPQYARRGYVRQVHSKDVEEAEEKLLRNRTRAARRDRDRQYDS